jgi:uncharacterized protein
MSETPSYPAYSKERVDDIPVIWYEPRRHRDQRRLAIMVTGLTGSTKDTLPYINDLADAGFLALSFDPWQHGGRGTESPDAIAMRVFGNFRRHMWPILGQTTLDTMRIIDWAIGTLGVRESVVMGGVSMGGDIAVAAAGIDRRIERVATVVSTPDWLRPGMRNLMNPAEVLSPGEPDAYARFFYDALNPLTHINAYARAPWIKFVCGAMDSHVPPDGALRFQQALQSEYPRAARHVEVKLVPGMRHMDVKQTDLWWPECLGWLNAEPDSLM